MPYIAFDFYGGVMQRGMLLGKITHIKNWYEDVINRLFADSPHLIILLNDYWLNLEDFMDKLRSESLASSVSTGKSSSSFDSMYERKPSNLPPCAIS